MAGPKLGQSIYHKNEPTDPVMGFEMEDLNIKNPLGEAPQPPKYIQEKLRKMDRVWRWVARPTVKFMGMRQYTTYSVEPDDRKKMDEGDCPAGVFVDAENKLCWREDAWLAWIPRRQFEWRRNEKRKLTANQKELAFKTSQEALKEAMRRRGADLSVTVEQRLAAEDD